MAKRPEVPLSGADYDLRKRSRPAKAKASQESFDEVVAPILTPERGKRLAIARMKEFQTQAELGAKLGIHARSVSRIESGGLAYVSPELTAAKLRAALSTSAFRFVMFGEFEKSFPAREIRRAFIQRYNAKQGNKTPRSERTLSTKWAQDKAREYVAKLLREGRDD